MVCIAVDPDLPPLIREVLVDSARRRSDLSLSFDKSTADARGAGEAFDGLVTWDGLIPRVRPGVRCFYILTEDQELDDWAMAPGPFHWSAYNTGPPFADEAGVNIEDSIEPVLDALARWIDSFFDPGVSPLSDTVTVRQTRHLERLIGDITALLETGAFGEEQEPIVLANVETIHVQLQSGNPDAGIIRRSLGHLVSFAGGTLAGVGGDYLTSLYQSFHLPWPH